MPDDLSSELPFSADHWSLSSVSAQKQPRDLLPSPGGACRVLVIESDRQQAQLIRSVLSALGVESCWVEQGSEALGAISRTAFNLVIVDLDVPDMAGLQLLEALERRGDRTRFIAISRSVTLSMAIEAMNRGARSVIERPVAIDDLTAAMKSALAPSDAGSPAISILRRAAASGVNGAQHSPTPAPRTGPASSAERWAALVLNAVHADHDPKTISTWARLVGVSRSVLCEYCRLVHVTPRDARDFARVMRAVHGCGKAWQPETMLDLADARTLRKLLGRAGILERIAITPSQREFLDQQQWIPRDNPGLRALERLLDLSTPA